MRAIAGLGVCLLAACDAVFRLDTVHSQDARSDAPPEICFEDDFEGAALDTVRWTPSVQGNNVVIAVEGGHLEIRVPEATTSTQDPYGFVSAGKRDYSGTTAEVEILQVPGTTAPSSVVAQFKTDLMNSFELFVQRDALIARKFIAGVQTDTSVPYDSVLHRFIRMRHDVESSEIAFEARGIDTPWLAIASAAAPVSLSATYFQLYAGSFNIAPAFTAAFDNVRIIGHCPF